MKNELNNFAREIFINNAKKGFWDDRIGIVNKMRDCDMFTEEQVVAVDKAFRAQAIALIHSELSEMLEADRKNMMDDKLTGRQGVEVEGADAFIRILDFMGGYKYDIGGATLEKLEYNKTRAYKHGKQY